MNMRQKVSCAIHGHELEHQAVDGWVVSTCQRCGSASELPMSAYSVRARGALGDNGMGMPGAWFGVIDGIGSCDGGADGGGGDGGGC